MQPKSALSGKDVAVFRGIECVLCERSMNAILEGGSDFSEGHADALEFAFIGGAIGEIGKECIDGPELVIDPDLLNG